VYPLSETCKRLSISDHAADAFGPLVETTASFHCRRFRYGGIKSLALVANEADEETPIDVLAFSVADPAAYGTLLGQAGFLGKSFVSARSEEPCPIFRTPLEWLQQEGHGVVILEPAGAAVELKATACLFAVQDIAQAKYLLATKILPVSRLLVPKQGKAAA
jgi:hypothetical protein